MLYLEDYLEMIEHLPEELRDRFTSMREMDLQVQNALESLEKRIKTFFSNASTMKPQERETEYAEIKKDYQKALEDADEKVHLANHMHDLLSLYVRRLEQECHKFKMELEADHAGITEILEKRSEEMDVSSSSYSQKENRYSAVINRPSVSTVTEKKRDPSIPEYKRLLAVEKMLPDIRPTVTVPQVTPPVPAPTPPPVNYYLGHMGAGGTAIVAAATQAIAATQQMQQGRRTASLKASYEAINSVTGGMSAIQTHELGISKELAGAAQTAIAAIQDTSKKNKKKSTKSSGSGSGSQSVTPVNLQTPVESPTDSSSSNRNDSSYDPNEPRYCICNEVAYGGMVACDNKNCPHEWFHYPCVGITDPPKGSWYCPQCLAAKKNRSSRKKKGPFGIEESVQSVMRSVP